MRKKTFLPRSISHATLTVLVLGWVAAGCSVGREDRPADVLARRGCNERLTRLGRQMEQLQLMAGGASDLFRITEAIHDARDTINTLKGTCARQPAVLEEVQKYEQQLDAIEEQRVWGGGRP